jgi:hypothetical protein
MDNSKLSLEKLKNIFHKHESILSSGTLILGFIIDYLTLRRVDFLLDNLLIVFYLIFAGASILIVNLYEAGRLRTQFFENIYEFLPFLLQFAFGGLFSAFVVFYSKSASLFTSGAFVLILFSFLVGNEFFKKRYSKLVFQVAIYFVAIFSFSIFFVPVLIKQMGAIVFLYSGAVSLTVIGIFILTISRLAPARYKESKKFLFITIPVLYIFINILYFTNIIPPIPLSLRALDVYHLVERKTGGNYLVTGERDLWQEKFNLGQVFHWKPGQPVYVFSSVFAPTDLNIKIVHDWQYFDESEDQWVSANKISFPIRGGRDEGYRGFSKKSYVFPGHWRVDIETERGQVIGRVRFDIEVVDFEQSLEAEII